MRFSPLFVFLLSFIFLLGSPALARRSSSPRVSVEISVDLPDKPAVPEVPAVENFSDSSEAELNLASTKAVQIPTLSTGLGRGSSHSELFDDGDADSSQDSEPMPNAPQLAIGTFFNGPDQYNAFRRRLQNRYRTGGKSSLADAIQLKEVQTSRGSVYKLSVDGQMANRETCDTLRAAGVPCTMIDNKPVAAPMVQGGANQRAQGVRQAIAQFAMANAAPASLRKCGEYVRKAIEAGIRPAQFLPRQNHASDFGATLTRIGFRLIGENSQIPNIETQAQTGDILIIRAFGNHGSGHASIKIPPTMRGGVMKTWVSDFFQNSHNPYGQRLPSYALYRYGA